MKVSLTIVTSVCVCVIQMTEHVKKKLCVKLISYNSFILVCILSHSVHRFLPIKYIQPSRSIVMLSFCCCIFMGFLLLFLLVMFFGGCYDKLPTPKFGWLVRL